MNDLRVMVRLLLGLVSGVLVAVMVCATGHVQVPLDRSVLPLPDLPTGGKAGPH